MNARQWREQMDDVLAEVRAGKMSVSAANVFVKMFQANIQSAQTQLNFYKARRENPDIAFLKEE